MVHLLNIYHCHYIEMVNPAHSSVAVIAEQGIKLKIIQKLQQLGNTVVQLADLLT